MNDVDQPTHWAKQPLTVDIFWRAGGGAIVAPVGELDLFTARLMSEALDCVRAQGSGPVQLDGQHLAFCDVYGLGAVLGKRGEFAAAGRALFVVRPSAQLRRLIAVARVGYLLQREPLAVA